MPLVEATCPAAGEDVRGWYYALLDYGAYLKKTVPNPSRRSKQHARQSKFEGSHRQKRAFALRCVLASPKTARDIAAELNAFELGQNRPEVHPDEVAAILSELSAEGMIACDENGLWRVAEQKL